MTKFSIFITIFSLLVFFGITEAQILDPQKIIEQRETLEQELQALEIQIQGYQELIKGKQREATTLERDIAILDAQIDKLRLEIRAREITINKLTLGIKERKASIEELLEKSKNLKESLAELLERIYEIEQSSLVELILSEQSLTDFFRELDSYEAIQLSLQDSLFSLKESNKRLGREKKSLENQKTEEIQLNIIQELSTDRIKTKENEKKVILKITRGKEKEYQKFLNKKEKDAATIRSRLFLLAGSPAIPFEKAVEYANLAFDLTGIRPAFLLAVITEESNLGENVGTGTWQEEMRLCPKQKEAFQKITQKLGLDPDLMPVSRRAWYGNCGGAMGPAQFMPTTWLIFEKQIEKLVGEPANPWEPKHAFLASALLLKDNGGVKDERQAALRYLAGSRWKNPSYAFYWNDINEIAQKYQREIDIIRGS